MRLSCLKILGVSLCLAFVAGTGVVHAQDEGVDGLLRNPGLLLNNEDQSVSQTPALDALRVEQQEELEAKTRDQAYDAAINGLLPLKPAEIKRMLKLYEETEKTVEQPLSGYPTARVHVESMSMDPSIAPPTIQTATGYVTSLTILDTTGQPWPIQDISWGGDFDVIQPQTGGHVVRITPLSQNAYGNMSMLLLDLSAPITFSLRTGGDEVHYRFDARIPNFGPNASASVLDDSTTQLAAGDTVINAVLTGVVPSDAERLTVEGPDGRTTAFRINDSVYVRTPYTMLSPAWHRSVQSADGLNVYALDNVPVVLLSDKGRMIRARLTTQPDSAEDEL